jgi:FkbM family methyltransferase
MKVFKHLAEWNPPLWRIRWHRRKARRRPGGETVMDWQTGGRTLKLTMRNGSSDFATAGEVFARGQYRLPDDWKPRTILDVGGNAGMAALYFAARYPEAVVHTFEPVPENAAMIRKQVAANGLTNVQVHEFGLSDRDATVEMGASAPGEFWDFQEAREGGGPRITAEMKGAAEAFASLGLTNVDLLKFDIEGGEKQFLPAIERLLPGIRWIIGELHGPVREWLPCVNLLARTHHLDLDADFGRNSCIFCAAPDPEELHRWSAALALKRT